MKQLLAYTREFIQHYPRKATLSVVLKLLQGFSRGVSLLMLLPLLRQGTSESADFLPDRLLQALFHRLGLPLTVPSILLTMLILTCIYSVLNYYIALMDTRLVLDYTRRLKSRLSEQLFHANWLYLKQKNDAEIYSVFLNQLEIIGFACNQLIQFAGSAVMLLIYLGLACMISVKMTALALLLLLPLLFVHRILFRKALENGSEELERKQEEYLRLSSSMKLMKEIKVRQDETSVLNKLFRIFEEAFKTEIRFSKMQQVSGLIFEIGAILIFSCFFLSSFYWFHFPVLELILLIYLISKLIPLASSLASNYLNLMNMLPSYESYQHLLRETAVHRDLRSDQALELTDFEQDIRIQDLQFAYPGKKPLFEHFSARLKIGHMNLIQGASGSGKSTLIELVLGLLPIDSGEILVNGKSIAGLDLKAFRNLIAYVPQEIQLLNTSLRENLLFSDSQERDAEIETLISSCAAFHFISELPAGLDTRVGEGGLQLSGGERQRVALLRALLRKPKLLIIDEGTAAMDEENECLIFDFLKSMNPQLTVVFVSHRKQLWSYADHRIEL